jgi:hypothetical protein
MRSGIASSPCKWSADGTYQTASVSKVVGGRSSWIVAIVDWSRTCFCWKATTRSVTDATERQLEAEPTLDLQRLHDVRRGLPLRLRVVVAAERLDDRPPRRQVELPHEPLLAEMEVDGALVDRRVRALALDDAHDRAGASVDDGECVGARAPERGAGRGIVLALPDPAARRVLELRDVRRPLERGIAERRAVGVVDRRFERGGGDVTVEHPRIREVEPGRLHAPLQQRRRLPHEVLVERVLGGDQDRQPVPAPPRAAPLLPQRRDRAREADGDRAIEEADVDPELERVGRRDAE